jgi:hypothetical protein
MFISDPNFSIPDPGSEFFPSRIPDPSFFHPGSEFFPSRIPDIGSRIRIKYLKYFLTQTVSGYRIRILFFNHPGSRGQKGTGSRIRIMLLFSVTLLFRSPVPSLLSLSCSSSYFNSCSPNYFLFFYSFLARTCSMLLLFLVPVPGTTEYI